LKRKMKKVSEYLWTPSIGELQASLFNNAMQS